MISVRVPRSARRAARPANLTQHHWTFTYGTQPPDYIGTTSKTTKVTDPRGAGQAIDWTTVVDFNTTGFPIRVIAPKKPNETTDWTTRMVWDTNNQLVCRRSPAANALNGTGCTAADTTGLQHEIWTYDAEAPYRLNKISHAAAPSTTRVEETFTYDEGNTFNGLWSERFENADLAGVPTDERSMSDLTHDWGTGAPPEIDDANTWSMRLSGMLFAEAGATYEFKIDGDDGYSLVIDNTVLLNCLYTPPYGINCGNANPPKKKLWDPDHRISIEYRDDVSTAHLKVYWRKVPSTTWVEIPATSMSPDLGLVTQKVAGPAGGGPLTLTSAWTFPNEEFKATRLPEHRTVTGGSGGQRQTRFAYDDWGRKTTVTRFSNAPAAEQAVTTFTYTDNATRSCLTKVIRPEGRERLFDCNADGERIQRTVKVRAVAIGVTTIQPLQTRTWVYTLDAVGRITRVDPPGAGATETSYDQSGRPLWTRVLMRGTGTLGTDWATTSFAYNDWPGLSSFHTMTETYPDPDPFSGPGGASVTHTFDWAGNEISRTDVRNPTLAWLTAYDAQNRVISTTSPDPDGGAALVPLTTTTTYTLTSAEYSVTATDPAGVQSKTWLDVLGRSDHTQSGSTVPSWFAYDAVGNVTRVQTSDQPIGQATTIITWRENDYDAFGHPIALRQPALVGGVPVAQTTSYSYHPQTGRLLEVNGPLPLSLDAPPAYKDVVEYTWDPAGRLTSSRMWTTPSVDFLTTITYDDADEQVRIASELSADGSKVQIRDYSYTVEGQLDTTTERHGAGSVHGDVVFDNDYDIAGRLTSVDSPRWPQTDELVFVHDDLGRETARYRDTGSGQADRIDATYLADGLVNTTSRSGGATYTFGYDALGRPTNLTDGTNPTSWSYYGTSSEASQRGWLKQLTTPAGATTYAYYEVGEIGGSPGQLEALTDPLSGGTTDYFYDEAGRVFYRSDPGGLEWWRSYEDQTGLIDTQEISNVGTPHRTYAFFDLGYDVAGNVTSRVEKLWAAGTTLPPATTAGDTGTGTWAYTYDSAGRMETAQGPNAAGTQTTWTYAYDGQGNRLSEQVGSVTETYVTDDQGWPLTMDSSATGPGTDATYGFDPDGGLLGVDAAGTAEDLGFAYDSWGGTDAATAAGASVDYTLDAFGRTTRRTEGSAVLDLLYAGASEDVAKTVEGSTTTLYAYSPGGPLASKLGAAQPEFFLRDLHGDVVGTKASGASSLADTVWFSPFGESTDLAGDGTSLGYQGDWTDEDTGAVDMLTRHYLPSLGRFTTRDILGGDPADPPSLNQYVYTSGSPITYSDPTGLYEDDGGYLVTPPQCEGDTACGGQAPSDTSPQPAPSTGWPSDGSSAPGNPTSGGGPSYAPSPGPKPGEDYVVRRTIDCAIFSGCENVPTPSALDLLQLLLAGCGASPEVAGAACDSVDGAISGARGDWIGAGIDALGLVPIFGWIADGGDAARTVKRIDDAIDAGRKNAARFLADSKHLPTDPRGFNKFAEGVDRAKAVGDGLTSSRMVASLQRGPRGDIRVRIVAGLDYEVGSKGQKFIRIILSLEGKIITAFPHGGKPPI